MTETSANDAGSDLHFLRLDQDGQWRIGLLINSHSHPMESIA